MSATQLGRVQLLIMQVLWANERATAREITDALNQTEPIAHSTVQTLLRGLEEKGAVDHQAEGRTFVFFPLVAEDEFKQSAASDLIDRVFGGDPASLVAHLLKHENVTQTDLEQLRKQIDH